MPRRSVLALLLLLPTACGETPSDTSCASTSDCETGNTCVDSRCVPARDAGLDASITRDSAPVDANTNTCGSEERLCGTQCCSSEEVCGTDIECCSRGLLCGSVCCDSGEVCEGAVCRRDCGAAVRCELDTGEEVCCAEGEVCASGGCFAPETPCDDFFDCDAGEYCEPVLGRCLPQPSGEACESVPTGGTVVPTLLWHWDGTGAALPTYHQVMMAPMIASLNDDDEDGDSDADDIPDVVFITFQGGNYSNDGVLRAVSGLDGSSIFDVTDPTMRTTPGGQVAIGDIDGDGDNEIVACSSDASDNQGALIAFNHDGSFLWRASAPEASCGQAAPAIADLDGDGSVEVFVRYTVLDGKTGNLRWHRACVGTGGWARAAHSPCDYTTAADLDGDGELEVVGGNVAYNADGSFHYDRTADFNDGYPAVGDLDGDGSPEVVVVQSAFYPSPYDGDHWLRALRADGTDMWGPVDLNADRAPTGTTAVGGGGPPTLANFDSDPDIEIAAAGAYAYAVFESDGSLRWSSPSNDSSSRKTGSSVFDFDGDGVAEVIYGDQQWLRVYDGDDGDVRFCLCNTSATLWEYPVVADVDTDGHAELIVASNDYDGTFGSCTDRPELGACERARLAAGESAGTHGIRVFASPTRDWVSTRRIWNQHSYHITNVSEDGSIPARERPNWEVPGLNNFRLNVQPGATNLADLTPIDLAVDLSGCNASLTLNFRLRNVGWAAAPSGVTSAVYAEDGDEFTLISRVTTTRSLLPGEAEAFAVVFDLAGRVASDEVRFRVVANDADTPDAGAPECRDGNNTAETIGSCGILF